LCAQVEEFNDKKTEGGDPSGDVFLFHMGTPEFERLKSYTELQRAVRESEKEGGCERCSEGESERERERGRERGRASSPTLSSSARSARAREREREGEREGVREREIARERKRESERENAYSLPAGAPVFFAGKKSGGTPQR